MKNTTLRFLGKLLTAGKSITATAAVLILLLLLLPLPLTAKDVEFTGMLRSSLAVRPAEADIPLARQTADMTLQGWGDFSRIVINPYAHADPKGETELGIREAYVDLFFPSFDIRAGKQAVVWGQAEGAFITDIVSPQDLSSFLLADFREIRMGVPAVKIDYYLGPVTLEAVWLPRFVPSVLPGSDSIWAVQPDFSWAPGTVTMAGTQVPGDDLENSEFFGKVSYFGSLLNAEVMAGYAWDDKPVMELDKSLAPAITAAPVHKRHAVVGGSVSGTLGSVVIRTEAAAYLDKAFNTTAPAVPDGIVNHNQVHALAGMDWSLWGVSMSAQYIIQYIHDHDPALLADEFEHTATFRIRDSFLSDTLTLELFVYAGLDPADALVRPSVIWSIEDGVELKAGAEIFLGDEQGIFGQYEKNTMATLALKWYF